MAQTQAWKNQLEHARQYNELMYEWLSEQPDGLIRSRPTASIVQILDSANAAYQDDMRRG